MTRTRIHNFSISLDGFATGEGLAADAPFGHAGHRLHGWMVATRFGAPILGRTGGTAGVDDAFAQQHEPGIGAEIMGAGKFGRRAGRMTRTGGVVGHEPPVSHAGLCADSPAATLD